MVKVKSSGIVCKENVKDSFEKVPMSLFSYLELGLINRNEFVIYIKLLQFYNIDYGYAFPTITTLMLCTGISSKATMHKCLDRLEEVGLIQKYRRSQGNNVYKIFKPLDQQELYKYVPEMVEKLNAKIEKLAVVTELEKERLERWKLIHEKEEVTEL